MTFEELIARAVRKSPFQHIAINGNGCCVGVNYTAGIFEKFDTLSIFIQRFGGDHEEKVDDTQAETRQARQDGTPLRVCETQTNTIQQAESQTGGAA